MPYINFVAAAGGGGPPLAFVSTKRSATNGAGTSVSTPSGLACTTGNHLLVYVRWEGGDTTTSMADTAVNTYTALTNRYNASPGCGGRWFYCLNATGHATNIFTVTFGASRSFVYLHCYQFSGYASGTVTEDGIVSTGTATSLTTSTGLTVSSGGVLLAGASSYNSTSGEGFSDASSNTWTSITDDAYVRTGYTILSAGVSGDTVRNPATGSGTNTGRVLSSVGIAP